MERKLYIPTSSLNFNNILSSESISPCAFYPRRGFGFKRLEKVELNNLDNVILLYDKFPYFDIVNSEIENYPMVVEINTSSCNAKFREVAKGIFACDETIYINPYDTVFWFNNINELVRTKVKSAPSIETKMADLYDGCLAVVDESISKYCYSLKGVSDGALNEAAIRNDIRIDKLKGFLYGYIIAYNNACSKNVAVIKMHIREIINSLSAILSAPDFKLSMLKSKKLEALYAQLEAVVNSAYAPSSALDALIKSKVEEYNIPNLVEVLKKEGIYSHWCEILKAKTKQKLIRVERFSLTEGVNKMFALDRYEELLYSLFVGGPVVGKPIALQTMPRIVSNRIDSIPEFKNFWAKLLNLYIDMNVQKDDFLNDRYKYAREGVVLCKEELINAGKVWENSTHKTYLNGLLSNLKSFTAFDINSIDSLQFKSFAMFFQKANLEISELDELMISKGEGDMRYVYSFWGTIFGFAEMPKTLTSALFNPDVCENKLYIYTAVYRELFNVDLNGTLPKRRYTMPKVETKSVQLEVSQEVKKEKPKAKRTRKTSKSKVETQMVELNFEPENVKSLDKKFGPEKFLASLKSISHFDKTLLTELLGNWNYTAKQKEEKSKEQVDFFINLSSKQGSQEGKKLYNIFTKQIAEALKKEIYKKLKIKI